MEGGWNDISIGEPEGMHMVVDWFVCHRATVMDQR